MVESAKPLRSDARRNRDLLIAAARAVFADKGLDAPLEEIARRAGVSIGTLYNRFPTRDELVECAFVDRLSTVIRIADEALADPDPWDGFTRMLTAICELQVEDRGYNEVAARGMPVSERTRELRERGYELMNKVITRAQEAGALRADITIEDMAFVVWGHSRTVEATATVAPRLWRRHLALMFDAFRAEAAHPLPEPPLAPGEAHRTLDQDC